MNELMLVSIALAAVAGIFAGAAAMFGYMERRRLIDAEDAAIERRYTERLGQKHAEHLQSMIDKLQSMLATARKEGFDTGHTALFEENETWSVAEADAMRARSEGEKVDPELIAHVRSLMAERPEPPAEYQPPPQ